MPRTNYVPDRLRPVGYAFPYIHERTDEDKPTVEVDIDAPGMRDSLIEAVCTALELWNPVFDHWEPAPAGSAPGTRPRPVFRGKHADKVLKFKDDVLRYVRNHSAEQEKIRYLRIASKYVHIRPMNGPTSTGRGRTYPPLPHFDFTPYTRDQIRPVIRRSDTEWDELVIRSARRAYLNGDEEAVNNHVLAMLRQYDQNRGTSFAPAYSAELSTLIRDSAPLWEYWRLVAYYVQDICDANYPEYNPFAGLPNHDHRNGPRTRVRR